MDKLNVKKASAESFFWKWNVDDEGKSPIKIRVTYDRDRKYYPVFHENKKLFLTKGEFDDITSGARLNSKERKNFRASINSALAKATTAIDNINKSRSARFTWEVFEKQYLTTNTDNGFLALYRAHLEDLKAEGRIGTYLSYQSAYNAFNRFRGAVYDNKGNLVRHGKELQPIDLTVQLLKKFEQWLQPVSKTTVAIYMRSLRVIFNLAIDEDQSLTEFYPFAKKSTDRKKFKITTGGGHKGDALPVDELRKLIATVTDPDSPEHEAKLIWMFSFHCLGMNMMDIALLKYEDIKDTPSGQVIEYVRHKTKNTEKEEKPIVIPMTDSIAAIIRELGNPDKRKTAYIFNIVTNRMDLLYQKKVIKQKTKIINKYLGKLCEANDLPRITTYWARHSYSNLLRDSGASTDIIREMLGHADIKTTEAYLKRFDVHHLREASAKVISLINEKTA